MGVLLFLVTIITSLFEQNFINYLIALIFLGLGWNFCLFGTSLLVLCYREEEKFRAQGYNDFIVYTIQAAASLFGVFLV